MAVRSTAGGTKVLRSTPYDAMVVGIRIGTTNENGVFIEDKAYLLLNNGVEKR